MPELAKLCLIALPDADATRKIQELMGECSAITGSKRAYRFPPHFTLWADFMAPSTKLSQLADEIADVASCTLPFRLKLNEFGFYDWRVAFLDIELSPGLRALHQAVLKVAQSYRTPWVPAELRNNPHFSPAQRDNVDKYGYHLAAAEYSPHITIAGNDMSSDAFSELKHKLATRHVSIPARVSRLVLVDRNTKDNRYYKEFRLGSAASDGYN